jgi:hypothetical protein
LDVFGKIAVNGTQMVYVPTITDGTMFIGNGGANLTGDSGDGDYNTLIGSYSGNDLTIGKRNTATGYGSLGDVTWGASNVAYGAWSLFRNVAGNYNTAMGTFAGQGVESNSFSNNSLFGYKSGFALTTGSNNILLGYQTGDNLTTGENNILLGYDIEAQSATSSSQLSIGNLIFATGGFGTGTTVGTGNVCIGTAAPGRRLDVLEAASNSQVRISQSSSVYSELYVDSSGDLRISATGGDIRALDENLWVCSGGACPSITPSGNGNLIVEGSITVGTSSATCDASNRGTMRVEQGAAGVADLLYTCLKTSSDTYQWVLVARGN